MEFFLWIAGKYVDEFGSAIIGFDYKTENGLELGQWARQQRGSKIDLSIEKKLKLESLNGWIWKLHDDRWQKNFNAVVKFYNEHGHVKIPSSKKFKGQRLRGWIDVQRNNELLTEYRKLLLDEKCPGWSIDYEKEAFLEGFSHLEKYVSEFGHACPLSDHETKEGFKLGMWIQNKRFRKKNLTEERIKLLESMDGWVWNSITVRWENNFRRLRKTGFNNLNYNKNSGLPRWVTHQRKRKNFLSSKQKIKLETLEGWSWVGPYNSRMYKKLGFNEKLNNLINYYEENKHTNVPYEYSTEDGHKLGFWVSRMRYYKEILTEKQKKNLKISMTGFGR